MCSPVLKHKLRLVFIFLINLTENVEVLLRHKARPYMKDDSDETALITAIRHGYTECIHLLAECPVPEKQRQDYFFPALQEAGASIQ